MSQSAQQHEKLFDEICNKLSELSQNGDASVPPQPEQIQANHVEKMQQNLKKFQTDIVDMQSELTEKIRTLEQVSFTPASINEQLKQLSDQLSQERTNNTRLSTDLAKSLEMCLQLQLEVQGAKAKAMQMQNEERKYSLALLEKNKSLLKELELNIALKDETASEFSKAKKAYQESEDLWTDHKGNLEKEIFELNEKNEEQVKISQELESTLQQKDESITHLNKELEQFSSQLAELELSAKQQNEAMKNLMTVAENKIVEIKVALDKKNLEADDYYSHLQKALTQINILKQENTALRDYISKFSYYQQQMQQAPTQS